MRKTIRKYSNKEVPEALLDRLGLALAEPLKGTRIMVQ